MTEKLTERDYEVLDACCELLSIKIDELKAENEKLKQEIKELAHYLACMTEQRNKANTCLQQIKTIVCGNYEIIDPQGRKDILKLITKAEEE